jgi:peptidoglycan hydrolase-like protein with peptidoglycan-binding domain
MRGTRRFRATAAALAAVSGIAVIPALMLAAPADAAAFCTGTSLIAGMDPNPVQLRVPTVGNGSGDWNCDLEYGDDNVAVARLQIALDTTLANGCNFGAGLAVDSDYGTLTRNAVTYLQENIFVPVDGEYGPVTAENMEWPVAGSNETRCGVIKT